MKKVSFKVLFLMLILAFTLAGCGGSTSTVTEDVLEGYWMDEIGNTLTFTGDGSVMWYGESYTYTIYDTDKVIIKDGEIEIGNYSFAVKKEVLELEDLKWKLTSTFFGSEKKQAEILNSLKEEQEAQMEADAKAEQERIDASVGAEYEAELAILADYQAQCIRNLSQATDEEDKAFYQSEIDAVQQRIDVLSTGNSQKINADSYEMACDWISRFILPEDIASSDKLIFMDEGLQYIDNTVDGSVILGYMVAVRTDNGDVAPMYGSYAVQFSTMSIYEYDVVKGVWKFATALDLIEE